MVRTLSEIATSTSFSSTPGRSTSILSSPSLSLTSIDGRQAAGRLPSPGQLTSRPNSRRSPGWIHLASKSELAPGRTVPRRTGLRSVVPGRLACANSADRRRACPRTEQSVLPGRRVVVHRRWPELRRVALADRRGCGKRARPCRTCWRLASFLSSTSIRTAMRRFPSEPHSPISWLRPLMILAIASAGPASRWLVSRLRLCAQAGSTTEATARSAAMAASVLFMDSASCIASRRLTAPNRPRPRLQHRLRRCPRTRLRLTVAPCRSKLAWPKVPPRESGASARGCGAPLSCGALSTRRLAVIQGIMPRSLRPTSSAGWAACLARIALKPTWPALFSSTQSLANAPLWMSARIALHRGAGLVGDHARAARVVAVLGGVRDRVAHVGEPALVDQVDDQLDLVQALEIGHLGRVAGLDQGVVAGLDQGAQAAAQHHLLAEQIGLALLAEAWSR